MSDNYNDVDVEVDETDSGEVETPKGLRRAANKSKQLEAELSAAKRELAFIKAGIPMTDPRMNYFMKGYEGDISPEAIRQAAVEAGFLQPPQQNPQIAQAAAAQQRVEAASYGAFIEDSSEGAALARLEQAMQEGGVEAMFDVARQYGIPTSSEM